MTRELDGGRFISHCPELRAGWTTDAEGRDWALLGLAVETRDDRHPEPLAQIATARSDEVAHLHAGWAGRWALVGAGSLHPDATALLGVFYGRTHDGAVWASSSPALAVRQLGIGQDAIDSRRLDFGRSWLLWYPPPTSRFAGLRSLLPSQVLDLATGAARSRPLLPEPDADAGDTFDRLARGLTNGLRRLPAAAGRGAPWLGLTGGADSRVVLAAAAAAGIEVRPYTRASRRMSVADRVLPPRLARAAGYGHAFMHPPRRPPADRTALIAAHSAGCVSDHDASTLRSGERDGMGGVMVGGHGFEVFWDTDWLRDFPAVVADKARCAAQIAAALDEPEDSTGIAGLRAWLDWVESDPQSGLDWRDRYALEQDTAGWHAAKEQLNDAARLERFALLNSARFYCLGMTGLTWEQRRGKGLQAELVRRLWPALAAFPCNPPNRSFAFTHPLQVVGRVAYRLRHGLRRQDARPRRPAA